MIVKFKNKKSSYLDLTPNQPYFVIGIEADDYRILNDQGKPYLYPAHLFEIIDPREPSNWVTEFGDENERYSYPEILNKAGFFEDFFDGKDEARSKFWQVVNEQLSDAA